MAFWKSASRSEPPTAPPAPNPTDDPALASVVDLAAGMLRDYGRTALNLELLAAETVRGWCENWAEHLLVGAPRPGDVAKPAPIERRDFAGALRFFAERRREETAFVARSLTTLQKTVWAFIRMLDGLLVDGGDADARLREELARLKTAAEGGSAEILRREVLETVEEIGRLALSRTQELRSRADGLSGQVRALCSELEIARAEGATDPLTRLFNRVAFDERLEQSASMSRLFGQRSSLLLVEIDGFTKINDSLSHLAGDSVLREVADALVRQFRVKSELVARYGGEEFAVLLWDTPLPRARSAADKIVSGVHRCRVIHDGHPIPLTVSVGVSQISPGESARSWLERTDRTLVAARDQGRDRCVVDES